MILRQHSRPLHETELTAEPEPARSSHIRGRIASFAAAGVTVVVGLTAAMAYLAVFGALEKNELAELNSRSVALMRETQVILNTENDPAQEFADLENAVAQFRTANPGYAVAVSPGENWPFVGDAVPVDKLARNGQVPDWSDETYGDQWVSVVRDKQGATIAVSRRTGAVAFMENRLQATLIGIVGLATLLAALTGALIARVTVRPLERLRTAVDEVTTSNELAPIDVIGDDEYGKLTDSLNRMMKSLQESRVRQSQLVADAGHELRTPLTSMRTNIELLLMLNRSGQAHTMPEEDLRDLENDVMAQLEEMSTLIGDLVDLSREEVPPNQFEPARLDEIIADALERVQRRRPDVKFKVRLDPWILNADTPALSRAPVNLLDNAAKWSPPGGTVRVSLRAAKRTAVLIIDDSGPGIPPEEREKVFERFYRSPEARAMPGSGLGLAITYQVLDRHGATVSIGESDDGGTRIRVIFPGRRARVREAK